MQDLYKLLGVSKSASQDEIKKAYRTLAKKLHPDRNPGDEKVAEKFKEVSAAYAILGDKEQRAKYDSGEIDASGAMRNPFAGAGPDARHSEVFEEILRNFTGGRGFGGARGGARGGTFEFTGSAEDIFADLFSFGGGRRQARRQPMRGRDVVYQMTVPFLEAVKGSTRRLTLQTGRTLDVKIPEGVAEGQQIRLKGQGEAGVAGGPAGDAMIKVHIAPHPYFRRDGDDIRLDVPITVDEAVLGAKIKVPTVSGNVTLNIPKGTSSGTRLRLKGKGVKRGGKHGDQIVTTKIVLPRTADPELEKAIADWREKAGYKVRQTFGVE